MRIAKKNLNIYFISSQRIKRLRFAYDFKDL